MDWRSKQDTVRHHRTLVLAGNSWIFGRLAANPGDESLDLLPFPVRCGVHHMVSVNYDCFSVGKDRDEVSSLQIWLGQARTVQRDTEPLNGGQECEIGSIERQRVCSWT